MAVVEDKRHMMLLNDIAMELQNNIVQFNQRANGITDKDELMALRLEQNDALSEMIHRHRRHLDFSMGKPVKPETHFGAAVLLPVFGGSN